MTDQHVAWLASAIAQKPEHPGIAKTSIFREAARLWREIYGDQMRALILTGSLARIVPDNELRALGILFPDRRYGEVVFLLNPELVVDNSGFNGGGWRPAGMHGYHPDDPESDAVFLSNRQPPMHLRTILDIDPLLVDAARGAVS